MNDWKNHESFFLFPSFDQNNNSYNYLAFDDLEKKVFFEAIHKIPWIGVKTAYYISMMDQEKLKEAIDNFDTNFFQSIPWVWAKTAKRILVELKNSFSEEDISKLNIDEKLYKNITSSLKALGYDTKKIQTLLKECPVDLKEENKDKIIKRLIDNL